MSAHLPACSLTIFHSSILATELPRLVFLGLRGQLHPPRDFPVATGAVVGGGKLGSGIP